MHTTAIVCTSILGGLLFGLGLAVSLTRGRSKVLIGHPTDATNTLHKLVRAHANTAEYAPFVALLVLYLGTHNPPLWVEWAMVVTTAARVAIVVGLLMSPTLAQPHPVRFAGALFTYLGGLALCLALLTAV